MGNCLFTSVMLKIDIKPGLDTFEYLNPTKSAVRNMNFDNMASHFREGRLLPRSWEGKLKLCKSAQLFDPLAQTSTKVVFISLHYPLSLREATF